MAANQPWATWQGGVRVGSRSSTRVAAMNRVDRPFQPGNAMILNQKTGEKWQRSQGSWSKIQERWPAAEKAKRIAESAA